MDGLREGVGLHVVACGSPFDGGIRLHGPFDNGEDANEWAKNHCKDEDWWAVPLGPKGALDVP